MLQRFSPTGPTSHSGKRNVAFRGSGFRGSGREEIVQKKNNLGKLYSRAQ